MSARAHTSVVAVVRARARRGVDLAVFMGTSACSVLAVVDLIHGGSQEPALAAAMMMLLAACALFGLLGRARWTPVAYCGLIVLANASYLASYGPWFGLGAVYVFAIALAFLFLSPRWAWRIGGTLVATPLVLGVLFELHALPRPVLILDEQASWYRAGAAAASALVGLAVVIGFTVRQLVLKRRHLVRARILERAARRERERLDAELAQARRVDSIAQLAAEVGSAIGAALDIVEARARALAVDFTSGEAALCLSDIAEATSSASMTMRSLTVLAPGAQLPARGNAADAARGLPKLVRRLIPERIALVIRADEDAWVGIATTDLARICANLALNARDAIADHGTITIGVTRAAAHVEIAVRDTGSGMTDEVKRNLFQPFFTTKLVGRGTGLGLATTKILVEGAAGTIAVTSELGRGSAFVIRLPLLA